MLRTGQLLHPTSTQASRPTPGASLPGTLASPRTGLTPAGCRQLVVRLRQVMASPPCPGARTAGRTTAKTVVGAGGFGPRTSSVSRNERQAIYLRKRSVTCGVVFVVARHVPVITLCFAGFPRDESFGANPPNGTGLQ